MAESVMKHTFSEVPSVDIPRSSFNRSHGYKTTFDADYLIPVLVDDVVPGDTFNVNMNFFCRLATPLYPIMDNMYLESFFFFVPYRLVWDNWERMHGAQESVGQSIDVSIPRVSAAANTYTGTGSLWDYFGLPIDLVPDNLEDVSCLPYRAYWLCWDDWFRDENLQSKKAYTTADTAFSLGSTSGNPVKRNKRHDYFTSALPSPQKGDAIDIPLGTTAPVTGIGVVGSPNATSVSVTESDGSTPTYADAWNTAVSTDINIEESSTTDQPNIFADLSSATSATINDLRLSFQTQRLLERDARSGTRYNEMILAHFGVTVPDFRVQRPEFLGGGSSIINVQAIANTTAQDSTAAPDARDRYPGNLAANDRDWET